VLLTIEYKQSTNKIHSFLTPKKNQKSIWRGDSPPPPNTLWLFLFMCLVFYLNSLYLYTINKTTNLLHVAYNKFVVFQFIKNINVYIKYNLCINLFATK